MLVKKDERKGLIERLQEQLITVYNSKKNNKEIMVQIHLFLSAPLQPVLCCLVQLLLLRFEPVVRRPPPQNHQALPVDFDSPQEPNNLSISSPLSYCSCLLAECQYCLFLSTPPPTVSPISKTLVPFSPRTLFLRRLCHLLPPRQFSAFHASNTPFLLQITSSSIALSVVQLFMPTGLLISVAA